MNIEINYLGAAITLAVFTLIVVFVARLPIKSWLALPRCNRFLRPIIRGTARVLAVAVLTFAVWAPTKLIYSRNFDPECHPPEWASSNSNCW